MSGLRVHTHTAYGPFKCKPILDKTDASHLPQHTCQAAVQTSRL